MDFKRYIGGSDDNNRVGLFNWMAQRIAGGWPVMPDDFRAIYYMQVNEDGTQELLVVAALTNWTIHSAEMHIATDLTSRWASRAFIGEFYRYAFEIAGRTRLNALVADSNDKALELHKRLGHTHVGFLKHEYGLGQHAHAFGITVEDWATSKWNRSARIKRQALNRAA